MGEVEGSGISDGAGTGYYYTIIVFHLSLLFCHFNSGSSVGIIFDLNPRS